MTRPTKYNPSVYTSQSMWSKKTRKLTNFRAWVLNAIIFVLAFLVFEINSFGQTTFTENSAAFGLDIGGTKDGGHAWADYDSDGDPDVLININSSSTRNYLMRNNGDGTFTNVQATLAPGMVAGDPAERQAAWGDINNDGRPDFMMNSSGTNSSVIAIQIFIQNADGTFGDGAGGTAPITVGEHNSNTISISQVNTEGAGFFDFEGDGDLDIFFDSHNYGIELLRNNYISHVSHTIVNPGAAGMFTHITPGNGSPTIEHGLNQYATDGDFGTAADVNDDGWVDIFMRKRDENDFFLNQGGVFASGSDLAQAENGNKGANGLWDLDNDGDLDAVWTENGATQIFRNDGPGIWAALGGAVFPGLPQPADLDAGSSTARIDALAGGDIDNDGDIDVLLVGNSRSYLYINNLNSPTPAPGVMGAGSAMSFSLDAQTFNVGLNGEGTTMIDVDNDGDLDIYMNISGSNKLYINNLAAANRVNHIIVDVTEDRDPAGTTGGFSGRTAIGTNVLIKDCDGNIISGLRQVNGVFGHGTQQPELVHFGLPLGEGEDYLIEVHYPNLYNAAAGGITRLIASAIAQPYAIPGTNHYSLTTTDADALANLHAPGAEDDVVILPNNGAVSIQISLFNNDNDLDGDNFYLTTVDAPAVGSVVIDDADLGLITYTYSDPAPFPGVSFDYNVTDTDPGLCPGLGKVSSATVTITEPCSDALGPDSDNDGVNDVCDLDDDNDGILDVDEGLCPTTGTGATGSFTGNVVGTITQGPASANFINVRNGQRGYSGRIYTTSATGLEIEFEADNLINEDLYNMTFRLSAVTPGYEPVIRIKPRLTTTTGSNASAVYTINWTGGAGYARYYDNATPDVNMYRFGPGNALGNNGTIPGTFDINERQIQGTATSGLLASGSNFLTFAIMNDDAEWYVELPAGVTEVTTNMRVSKDGTSATDGVDFRLPVTGYGTDENGYSAREWLAYEVEFINPCADADSDGDGVADYIDLDSDNDGIYDLVEAGHGATDANADGVIDGLSASFGDNGLFNGIETSAESGVVSYTPADFDSDGNLDAVELDADGDTCSDVSEAGFTDGDDNGLLGSGTFGSGLTVDANGVVTSGSDGYTIPSDDNSNTVFDFQEIEAPVLTCGGNVSSNVTSGCIAALTIASPTLDYCSTSTLVNDFNGTGNASGNYPVGTTSVEWTLTYNTTQTLTCSQNVVVNDNVDPVPNAATLSNVTGSCEITSLTAPTANDNCAGSITGTHDATLPITAEGTTLVTWSYDDGNGNITTQEQNVILDDTTDPLTPTLANVTGQCSATATAPSTTDACEGTITGTTTDPLTYTTQGTHVITWTFDDGNGNSIDVDQNVIIDDTVDPVTPTLGDVLGQCNATAPTPTTTDICEGTITGTTTDAVTYTTQGTHVITWTFDDGNGNSINVDQNVILDDTGAPTPDVASLPNATGQCSVTVTTVPTASDGCGITTTINGTTTDPLTYTAQGTYTITWSYDDGNGNISTQDQTVIVDDTTDPVTPTLANVTGQCNATAPVPTTTDVCEGIITGTTTDPLTYTTQGTHVITWTFNDGNGNSINIDQNVVVDDTTPPVTPTLANVTGQCNATAPVPTTTDACVGTVTGTTTDPLTYTTQGTHVITWTFNDGNGNSIDVDQNVIVDDTVDPLTPTLSNVTGQCSATAPTPTTTDACVGTVTGTTTDPLSYTTQGTHVITWTFDDGNGNSIAVDQNVIIDDTVDPVTPTLGDVLGQCTATATAPTTTDVCSGTVTGTTTDPLTYTTQGTHVITWTFDDGNGNSINVDQNVILDDTGAPTPDVASLPNATGQCSVTVTTVPTASDGCGTTTTINGTTTDPLTYTAQGTYTITWSYDDGNGNISTQDQTVIVDDTTDPVTPTLANVTGQCNATAPVPTTTDVCEGIITGTTTDPLTYTTQGTHVITWTFDDGNGNSINVDQNVVVDDTTPPVTPTLANVTGQCNATAPVPTTTDACVGTVTGTTTDPLTYTTQGTHVITWTFNDGNGNSIDVDQNVIVDDTVDPLTPTLSNVTGQCSATAPTPTTTDACVGTVTGTTTDPLSYTTQGTHVITWTFDDGNGNSIAVDQNVIIDDTVDPVTPTLGDVLGQCTATATAPTTTDVCSGTVTGTTTDPLTYTTQGTHVITWTFDDGNGNSINVDQNVILDDTGAPTPDVASLPNATGQCSVTVTTVPTASDGCGITTTINGTTTDPLTYTAQGTYTITWSYDDGNGNISTQDQTVIVDDTTDPVTPTLANVTGQCNATAPVPTTTDVCEGIITGTTTDPLTYTTQGTHVITWTFNDGNGNSINIDQNVVVDDTTPPVTPTLANVTGQCNATAPVPTTTDACVGTVTGTTTDPLTYTTQGTHVITWTFNDGNGNSIDVDQNVIVDDTVDPLTPTLSNVTGQCSATAPTPTTTDACVGTVTGTTTDPLSYTTQGTHVITWTFDDGNGNSIAVDQNVIIDDTVDPVTPTLGDVLGQCTATATAPTTTDVCSGTVTGTTTDPLTYTTQGTHVITWTFDDGNGNSINVDQNVILDDTGAPTPDVASLPNATGQCSVTVTTVPTASDGCGTTTTINGTTTDPLTYTAQGTYTITWSYDDGNGNISTQDQTVIVDDTTDPVTPTLANVTGQCNTTAPTPTTTDICEGIITGTTTDPLTYTTQGTHVITWNFDDGNGNSINVDQNVIVDDTTPPLTPTLANVTGQCNATAPVPTTTDACVGTVTGTTSDPLSYTTQGTHVITWNFDDGNGNSIDVDQNVIVDDTVDPITPTLANVTGQCSATAPTPTTTDACVGTVTGTTTDPVTYTTQGTHVITWTFDDGNGNSIDVDQNVIIDDTVDPVTPTLGDVLGQCTATASAPTTTDVCSGTVTGTTTDAVTYTTQGTHVITWTFDDGNGNSIDVNQNVILDDTGAPSPDVVTLPNATGQCSVTVTDVPTASDGCGVLTTIDGTTTDPLTYTAQGTYTITWSYDDGNGNISTQDQTVIVDDTTDPVTPTLANVTGQCNTTAPTPTTTDICEGIITGTTTDPLTYTTQGTHVITWNFDDGNGNSINVDQNVIVDDTTPPLTPTLANVTGQCNATAPVPTTTDACVGTVTGTTSDPLSYTTQGTHVITWNFDDGNGNSIDVDQNVIVDDTVDPITPTLANVTGQCSATAPTPTTTDACVGTVTGTTTDPVTYTTQGTHVITWTFDDGNGNSIDVDQNVIIDDTVDPVTPTLGDVLGQCAATATAPTTTDVCSGTVTGTTTDPLTYTTQGTHVITWTFDDGNGNSINVDQNVILDDTGAPTPDVASLPNATGQCSVTVTTVPTASDGCGVLTTIDGTTTDPLTYTVQGTYTITWSYDDGNGNLSTQDQTVIVDDTTDPVTPTLANATGQCNVTAPTPTTTDICEGIITGTTTDPLTYTTQGTHVITWNFDDGNGNSINVDQNVIVDDTTPPLTPTLANVTGQCDATAIVPTTTDACEGTITGTTTDPLTYATQGTHVITWNFDDGNGNSIDVDQNVIVDDTVDPVTPTLANVIGQCDATVTVPTTTDVCEGTITGTTIDPLTYATQGTHIITWNFDDGNGNSIDVDQNVIIDDTVDPVTPVLADLNAQCDVTAPVPTTTDICEGIITGTTTDPVFYDAQGLYVITWTFDDGNGNSIDVDQNVTIADTGAPTPDLAVLPNVVGQCDATVTVIPTASDGCGAASNITGTTLDPLTYTVQGTYTITWSYDDGNGNISTQNQTIIVDDTTDPVTPVLANITGQCDATAPVPTTTDICIGTITGTTTDPLTYTTQGTHVITWNFNDGNGNSIDVNQNVVVNDTTDPAMPVLLDVIGQCDATAPVPTTTDICVGTVMGTTTDPLTYNTQGTHVITWNFDDGNGNSINVDQNVIIDDTVDPVVPILLDVIGQCDATAPTPTTSDVCVGLVNGTTTDPITYSTQGTHVITWNFDDGNGNSIDLNQNVIIEDTTTPIAICQNINLGLDLTGNATITASEIDGGSSDNCSVFTLSANPTSFTSTNLGDNNVTLFVTDDVGNIDSCIAIVTVADLTPPNAVCSDTTLYLNELGQVSIIATDIDGGSTDNGVIASYSASQLDFDCTDLGVVSDTLTVTDLDGNSSNCIAFVTVLDTINPIVLAQDLDVYLDSTGNVSIQPSGILISTDDNCFTPTLTIDEDDFDCSNIGDNVVVLTATDSSGNIFTDTSLVNVIDEVSPNAVCQDFSIGTGTDGTVTITAADIDNGSNDACGVDTLILNQYIFDSSNLGVNSDTLTVIDVNGNQSICISNVTILDLTPPVAVCHDTTLFLNDQGQVSIVDSDIDGGSFDNGVLASVMASQLIFDCSDIGIVNDTLTVTDLGGNTDFCVAFVTVVDSISPTIVTCAIDTTEFLNTNCEFVMGDYRAQMVSYDNCTDTLDIVYTQSPLAGEIFGGVGSVIPVTITGTDENGNFSTCAFEVSLLDSIAPAITCPLDIVVDSDPGLCSSEIVIDQPAVSDNCDFSFINDFTGTDNASGTYLIDTTQVVWTASDVSGNSTICVQSIIVVDNEAPEILCSPDIEVTNDEGFCGATVTYDEVIYSDNCTIDELVLVEGFASEEFFDVGLTIVEYQVTDVYGNFNSCEFNVVVLDTELPVINCPDNIVSSDSLIIYDEPFFTDNCSSDLALIDGLLSDEVFPDGYTTVVYVTTDEAGLSAECSFEVLVNSAPVAEDDFVNVLEIEDDKIIIPLDNDYDNNGDEITVVSVSSNFGEIELFDDGSITYFIPMDWCGQDSVEYVIQDIYGAQDTAMIYINVECLDDLIIPQIFTPNDDGVNDLFEILGIYKFPENKLEVYNRWGHKVFEKSSYKNTWGGTSEAELTIGDLKLPVGTYFYILSLDDELPLRKGFVYINTNQ